MTIAASAASADEIAAPSSEQPPADAAQAAPERFPVEIVPLADLRPHPRNYRSHPEDQIKHLAQSFREHGWYKNIVVAQDGTVLAGHGIRLGALAAGETHAPIRRLPLHPDSSRALKVLAADNEISHLAVDDDRALSEILRYVKDDDAEGLLGTGYDDMMLATLVMVTRPESEIRDHNEAAHWVGLPEYESFVEAPKVIVSFRNLDDRKAFFALLGQPFSEKTKSLWFPHREDEDPSSLRFVAPGGPPPPPADGMAPPNDPPDTEGLDADDDIASLLDEVPR